MFQEYLEKDLFMPANEKKVSIVMCTCNGEKYLKEQIESIINQTYPIYEFIIQDDCSTDHTIDILRYYEKKFSYIRIYQNEKQKGITVNFFSAIARTTGDYIALSDQDDIWELNKIEMQISYAEEYLLISCMSRPFASDINAKVRFDERKINTHLERVIYLNMLPGHTMLFRKSLIKKIPDAVYWDNIDCFSGCLYDHLIAMVAASANSIICIPQILVNHRRLINSRTYNEPLNFEKTFPNILRFIGRTFSNYFKLRPVMRMYFATLYRYLEQIDFSTEEKQNAMTLAYYQSKSSPIDYISLTLLCIRLRKKLFYAEEKNPVLSTLRAVYFPISCSDYFRYLLNKQQGK